MRRTDGSYEEVGPHSYDTEEAIAALGRLAAPASRVQNEPFPTRFTADPQVRVRERDLSSPYRPLH